MLTTPFVLVAGCHKREGLWGWDLKTQDCLIKVTLWAEKISALVKLSLYTLSERNTSSDTLTSPLG